MQAKFLGFLLIVAFFFGCSDGEKEAVPSEISRTKSVIVFYSQNGTTKSVAEEFQKNTGAALWELQMEKAYPSTYDSTIAAVKAERDAKSWPKLLNAKVDLARYDTIYLGYPIMFGTFAPPLYTFLDSNDLKEKVVVPFCTYGSGGLQNSVEELKSLQPQARVLDGYGISNKRAKKGRSAEEVKAFVSSIGNSGGNLMGAFSELRSLSAEDSSVFARATADYAYLHLEPFLVASQVVAGMNYVFHCRMTGPDGRTVNAQVRVFEPLPVDGGEPEMLRVDRE